MTWECIRKWRSEPVSHPRFKLGMYYAGLRLSGKDRIGYRFYCMGKLIFKGTDFGCSPMHAIDSLASMASLLSFLSLKPGDTDREWFATYNKRQLAFCQEYAEELQMIVCEMEERARG